MMEFTEVRMETHIYTYVCTHMYANTHIHSHNFHSCYQVVLCPFYVGLSLSEVLKDCITYPSRTLVDSLLFD